MATIVIKRKRELVSWLQIFRIYIDGNKIGSISNGQTEEFEIPEGNHTIKAKVYWCGSNKITFSVAGDQEQTVIVSTFKFADLTIVMEFAILILHSFLKNSYGISYIIWLAIPFFLWTLYYSTFGYNKYIRIEEDPNSLTFKN